MSLIANIGVLAIFKYYNFINENITQILANFGYKNVIPYLSILLPIGLSFHTFQAMSYTFEVYRGNQKAERHFGIYALYVMFFPQLVAGPIERPQNVLHQFHEKKYFDTNNVITGLRMMLWGMFKKVVIADRLAELTDKIFTTPQDYSATTVLIGIIFFSFQIFCDFSGYSDIALGTAKIMGYNLMTNFNRPYSAKSISEFWKRWHISLSTWFRDYLYIPLGGNRVKLGRFLLNTMIVFLISGLWHGAKWTFVVWGALHGCYMIFEILFKKPWLKIKDTLLISRVKWIDNTLQKLIVFISVSIAWTFFRADSFKDAAYILHKIPSVFSEIIMSLKTNTPLVNFGISNDKLILCFIVIIIMETVHYFQHKNSITVLLNKIPIFWRWGLYYTFIFMIIYLGVFHNRQFIYFQF